MMNKKRSSKLELSKYAFILPLVIFAAGAFTVSKADGKITEAVELARETEVAVIKNMLQKPDPVKLTFDTKNQEIAFLAVEDRHTKDSGFLLDGKLVEQKVVEQLDAKDIESIVVNIDNDLTKQHGLKSLLNIKTKEYAGTVGTPSRIKSIHFNEEGKMTIDGPMSGVAGSGKKQGLSADRISFIAHDSVRSGLGGNKTTLYNVEKLDVPDNRNILFIVDGQRKAKGYNINDIRPDDIESIHVWKDEAAVVKFGSDAKEGVVEITLKDKKNPTVTVKAFGEKKKAEEETALSSGKILGFGMKQDSTLNKVRISSFRVKGVGENGSPLIIIDGVEKDDKTIQKIDPNSIESITVLRDESASTLYGSKGKDGVMLITTKKNKDSGKDMKEIVVVGRKAEVSITDVGYSDDDTFFIDGKAVSKNEFKAVPEEKIEWKTGSGKKDGKGTRREIHTKK